MRADDRDARGLRPGDAGTSTAGGVPMRTWVGGARPRTLTLSAVPVVLGTAAASEQGSPRPVVAVLALLTALLLQIGVNYANDYSDGVRGTDRFRRGPARLTGSGTARPGQVLAVALSFLGLGAVSGLAVVLVSQHWWLLLVGAAALLAAWLYTGGSRPYGYAGFGEVSVFVFFGLVATSGTEYVQAGRFTATGLALAGAAGFFACAVLMINNIRDIAPDALAGKRTLAVRLGRRRARVGYVVLLIAPYVLAGVVAATHPVALLVLATLPLTVRALLIGVRSEQPLALVGALKRTSAAALLFAIALAVGLVVS